MSEVGVTSLLFASDTWKPEAGSFGGLALIVGTLATALGAIALGAGPAVLSAVWLTEFAPDSSAPGLPPPGPGDRLLCGSERGLRLARAFVYLVPIFERLAHALRGDDAPVTGEGLAAAAFLLAVMIAPTVLLLSLDALSRVPRALRDASAALGASPWQTAFSVSVPYGWRGLLVATFFGFARAAGETMAVQMVIGGARRLPKDFFFSPTTTISAQIVMDMQEASGAPRENDVLYFDGARSARRCRSSSSWSRACIARRNQAR